MLIKSAEIEDIDLDVLVVPDVVPAAFVHAPYAVAKAAARGRGRGPRGDRRGGRAVAVAPLLAGLPAVVMPDTWGPMKFDFDCHGKVVTVHLDGYSHDTGNRRCYTACPYSSDGHVYCHKYIFVRSFEKQWHGFAFIILWMRAGAACLTHDEHMTVTEPTLAEFAVLEGDMPKLILDGVPDRL